MAKKYINDNWYFKESFDERMLREGYDYTSLTKVRIPHTFKETPLHYFDEHEYQMNAAYIRTVNIPAEWKDKDVSLTFEGIAHYSKVYVNGVFLAEHKCGYTAFSVNLNDHVKYGEDNIIVVNADSNESLNIPPFGFVIDYMTYGGMYREAYIEVKEKAHMEDVYVSADASGNIRVEVKLSKEAKGLNLENTIVTLNKNNNDEYTDSKSTVLGTETIGEKDTYVFNYSYPDYTLWSPEEPNLFRLECVLKDSEEKTVDKETVRFGFRSARFEADGFYLNNKKYKIRGLNRHQSYPYVGYAMPKNPQKRDAYILKKELGLNAVRTSHYPQSHYFLDACDEIGLLVFTEMPGWQHIGNEEWKDIAVENTKDMVLQYRNHTSIILWGVRINESVDDDDFYKRTNQAARELDPMRQTGGVRCYKKSNLLEDVYTYNDFVHSGGNQGCDKKSSVTSDTSKGYLISEYMGHMFPTKAFDWEEHRLEDALRHARVLNDVASNEDIAGSFGWCMFDYNTHKDFGSGDRICYHGVTDMFRNPKMAAFVYSEMQDERPVLEISSSMDIGEHPGCNRNETYIFTNADSVKMYKNDNLIKEYKHNSKEYPNLKNAPIQIDDYIGDTLEKEEKMSHSQAEDVKSILNRVAKFGLYKMDFSTKLKAAKMMLVYHMKMDDAVALYNKYIGDWGGSATTYRFEAVKNGEVVKTINKSPMTKVKLLVEADHTELTEDNTYDVSCVRIRAVDENDNILNYYNDSIILDIEGEAEIIGPKVIALSGGMGGTYIRTVGKEGKAKLSVSDAANTESVFVEFKIKSI